MCLRDYFVLREISKSRKCASGSLFKSPVAPTTTRFKHLCFLRNMSTPRNCASGSLFKSPVAPAATRFKHFRANFFGTHFPSKLAQNTTPVRKKRDPGILGIQSGAVHGSHRCQAKWCPHPSSRAGDQDDVSSQANSLKREGP